MDFSPHEQRTGQAARRLRYGDRDVQLRSQVTIYNCRIGGIVLVPGCNYPPLSAADLHGGHQLCEQGQAMKLQVRHTGPAVRLRYPMLITTLSAVEEIVVAPDVTSTGFLAVVVLPSPTWPKLFSPHA
jgi:hypothetical protein